MENEEKHKFERMMLQRSSVIMLENLTNKLYKCEEEKKSLLRSCVLLIVVTLVALSYGYYRMYMEEQKNAIEKRILTNMVYYYKSELRKSIYTNKIFIEWDFVKNNLSDKEIHEYICNTKKQRLNDPR
jgi:hypothetical protein